MRKQLWVAGREVERALEPRESSVVLLTNVQICAQSCVCLYKKLNLIKCLKITVMCLCKELLSSVESSYS